MVAEKSAFEEYQFAKSRIATIDTCDLGRKKNHVVALLEIDVTSSREKLKKYKKDIAKISYNAWLIKVISATVQENKSLAAFRNGKRKTIVFNDINVSFLVEKELNGEKIPLPVLIEKASTLEIETITKQLNDSKHAVSSKNQLVIQKQATRAEQLYYYFPAWIRKTIWKYLFKHPRLLFSKMGNVAITSLGMYGQIHGWFIPISIHPICFGIGSIVKKPVVLNDKIEIREMMNMTVLIDHDVIDGAKMARFINTLIKNMEKGTFL